MVETVDKALVCLVFHFFISRPGLNLSFTTYSSPEVLFGCAAHISGVVEGCFTLARVILNSDGEVESRYFLELVSFVTSPEVDIHSSVKDEDIVVAEGVSREGHWEDTGISSTFDLIKSCFDGFGLYVLESRLNTSFKVDNAILPKAEEKVGLLIHQLQVVS
jgi:hypothetical protein